MRHVVESIANVDALQRKVLRYIDAQGSKGATSDEVEAALGIGHSTVSPRVRELFKKSYLRESGQERETRKGRMATVWVSNYPKASDPLQYVLPNAVA
jgi:predicted transcriptional regulator